MSAAVLGRCFTTAALAAVAEADPEESGRSVEILLRQEMLTRDRMFARERWSARLPGAVVRDVAYRTLARAERQRRHLRQRTTSKKPERRGARRSGGDHLLKAFQADPAHPQAAVIAERARPALVRAARRARAMHAPDRALEHLNDALSMVVDDDERAAILEDAAAAAQAAGSFDVAESDLRSRGQRGLRWVTGRRGAAPPGWPACSW